MRFKVVLMTVTDNVDESYRLCNQYFTCNARALNMTHNSGQALIARCNRVFLKALRPGCSLKVSMHR